MMVKLWDWDNKWQLKHTFEGHTHYVMQLVINPKDNNTFASASLDKTIKVWQFGSSTPNFTLEGHEKGVNCVDYYHGGDKPYLISGADDKLVKIWDYQNKTCVATLSEHSHNVSAVCFHPELPIIITGSEDSTVRIYHSNTNRLETTLNYGLDRVWCISSLKGSNNIAIGYDDGSVVVKLGREEPAVSMDASGKILWAKHSEMQQANLKAIDQAVLDGVPDGERIPITVKDMGACEIYPQTLAHSSNGRFVVACGDGEYIIYTAMALRNKAFGSGLEFVWGNDPSTYAVRESSTTITIFKNFKEANKIKPDIIMSGMDGGHLLSARSSSSLCFYDWETNKLIRRIEIAAKKVYWSESGDQVAIAGEESFYILKYNAEVVANANPDDITVDGIEDAFDVIGEQNESVKTAIWVGDCFIFTTGTNRLNYYVGGEVVTIAHSFRSLYLLGYIQKDNRVYLCDKDHNIVSYSLLQSVLEYQTAVMRHDFDSANQLLNKIPKDQRTRVAHFLEKQGFRRQALAVSQDPEHRFELALNLGELKTAYEIALQVQSDEKWNQLGQAANLQNEIELAAECMGRARDYGGLLVLATATGDANLMSKLAQNQGMQENNVNFFARLLLGDIEGCLNVLIESDRLPEAAFFAHTYCPSKVPAVVSRWKAKAAESLSGVGQRNIAESLADPVKYENLFPGFAESLKAESYLQELSKVPIPASRRQPSLAERNLLAEMKAAEANGDLTFDEEGNAVLRGVDRNALNDNTPSIKSPARFAEEGIHKAEEEDKTPYVKPETPPPTPPSVSKNEPPPPVESDEEEEEEEESDEAPAPSRSKPPIQVKAQEEAAWSDDDDEFMDPPSDVTSNKTGGNQDDINLDDLEFEDGDQE